jgi:hypothetical protein
MVVQDKNLHTINSNYNEFNVISLVSETICTIKWSNIDSIIFSPNRHSEDCAQWIIYLNEPPIWELKPNASWLNKLTYLLINKKGKKQRIRDDMNKHFYDLPEMVEKNLNKTAEINYSEDNRKGELISRKVTVKGNKTITEEYRKPKRSDELPWKMLYDRYNRTVEDIYNRDGAI